jgi:Xaa-Pro dipeptidase
MSILISSLSDEIQGEKMDLTHMRLGQVQQKLQKNGIDCLALIPGSNLRWLTGMDFHLMERALIFFIPAEQEPVVVLPVLEKIKWDNQAAFPARSFAWEDAKGPQEAVRQAAIALPALTTLAVEDLCMRVMEYRLVQHNLPEVKIVQAEEIMAPLRLCKDAGEITAMRKAVKICETALEEIISGIAPDMTERQIAGRLSSALLLHGGESIPFEPQVLSGPRSALPHGGPTERRIISGDLLLFDFVTKVDGYFADLTRTFVVGREPNKRQQQIYQAVLNANETGRKSISPGLTCESVDTAVRSVIESTGFGENFIHRTGHGLGLEVHEPPYLVAGNKMQLEAGMAVTVEPGVYIEGWGGVRIEDDVVVSESGGKSLSSFDRGFRVIGI